MPSAREAMADVSQRPGNGCVSVRKEDTTTAKSSRNECWAPALLCVRVSRHGPFAAFGLLGPHHAHDQFSHQYAAKLCGEIPRIAPQLRNDPPHVDVEFRHGVRASRVHASFYRG